MTDGQTHETIAATLRKATAALRDADVPFMLGGSVACWARGGPRSQNDVDLMVKPEDADRAAEVLARAGMHPERPPEDWLLKVHDGDVVVDLIFRSLALEIDDQAIAAAEEMPVLGVTMRVLSPEDVIVGKLLALSEQDLEYGGLLEIARALREQIRWKHVIARSEQSPYARAFFALLEELGVIEPIRPPPAPAGPGARPSPADGVPAPGARDGARVCVFAPAPLVTVTVEPGGGGVPEIHMHAGGQGFWAARMARGLGARVTLCTALGGEPGGVLRGLIQSAGIDLEAVASQAPNGAYVHDRRGGQRRPIAEAPGGPLSRHELDELYGTMLASALKARLALLTGPADERLVRPQVYARLAADLRQNGVRVLADLAGEPLRQALSGIPYVLKLSERELRAHDHAPGQGPEDLVDALERLHEAGAENVIVTRGERPALARLSDRLVEVAPPRLETVEHRGTGDSLFAAVAVALAEGKPLEEALRFAVAAGTLNVARHGLGSGQRETIEELTPQVKLRPLSAHAAGSRRAHEAQIR